MATKVIDISPQLEVLTGNVLAPGNAIHVRGWFRRINADGQIERDNAGPIRAYLTDAMAGTAPVRPALTAQCAPVGVDGKWNIAIAPDALTHPLLSAAFGKTKNAFLIIEQTGVGRWHVAYTYADGKPAPL